MCHILSDAWSLSQVGQGGLFSSEKCLGFSLDQGNGNPEASENICLFLGDNNYYDKPTYCFLVPTQTEMNEWDISLCFSGSNLTLLL